MVENNSQWTKLDNAGKLYPSIASSRVSTAFRLTAVLKESVNKVALQKSLELACLEYPVFNSILRKGLFWYYFQKTTIVPKISPEAYYPCISLNLHDKATRPFVILYYKNRIHLEMSHAISDGSGATVFFRSLLKYYYNIIHGIENSVVQCDVTREKDAFHQYYEKNIPVPQKVGKAYHFPLKLLEKGIYHITTGTLSYSLLKDKAAEYNTSPTRFIIALYLEAIQSYIESDPYSIIRPIVINVPVNLRDIFPSDTLRNFFISLTPFIDPRLGHYKRREIVNYLDYYFKLNLNEKELKRYISRNVSNELFWHVRLIPLLLKDAVTPFIYNYYGESSYTSSISNIGKFQLEKPYSDMIERMILLPPPSEGNLIKMTAVVFNDAITLTFGSLTAEKKIESIFFKALRSEGLKVKIETNYE